MSEDALSVPGEPLSPFRDWEVAPDLWVRADGKTRISVLVDGQWQPVPVSDIDVNALVRTLVEARHWNQAVYPAAGDGGPGEFPAAERAMAFSALKGTGEEGVTDLTVNEFLRGWHALPRAGTGPMGESMAEFAVEWRRVRHAL